jgi:hypothetical protein
MDSHEQRVDSHGGRGETTGPTAEFDEAVRREYGGV